MSYSYNEALGEIIDLDDGQLIATASASCTPEQARLLTAAPELALLCERCLLALDEDCFPMLRERIRQVLRSLQEKGPDVPDEDDAS